MCVLVSLAKSSVYFNKLQIQLIYILVI